MRPSTLEEDPQNVSQEREDTNREPTITLSKVIRIDGVVLGLRHLRGGLDVESKIRW